MAFAISEQYRRFVEFAQTYVNQGNEDAIARDGGAAAAPLAGRTITIANDNDHIKQWLRPGDQRNANDVARDLFKRTIIDMFGGSMANVPQEVICATSNGKYYRAGVEYIEWAKRGYESNEKITAILNCCIDSDGVNIKRLLRMTTNGTGNTVSRTDGNQIKPHIRMRYMNYAYDVYHFFYENAGHIRKIARQYTDIEFISAFYNLCVNWSGWSWPIVTETIKIPDYRATLRDGIEIVMWAISYGLPIDARQMIVNIATHKFSEIVPAAEYGYSWEHLTRRMDPKQQR